MSKTISIIITLGLLVALGVIFYGGTKGEARNVEIRDGVQYVTINAKSGYFPEISTAKAGVPTKLIVKTNGTYDCSASLVVRAANFQKILPQTGETEIDLGTPVAGVPIQGLCSMGMYSFEVNFES